MPLTLLKSWGVSYCKSCINYKHSEGNKLSMDLSSTQIFVKKVSMLQCFSHVCRIMFAKILQLWLYLLITSYLYLYNLCKYILNDTLPLVSSFPT